MGFGLYHGVRNTPWGEKCYLGGRGVKEGVCVCVCVCVWVGDTIPVGRRNSGGP